MNARCKSWSPGARRFGPMQDISANPKHTFRFQFSEFHNLHGISPGLASAYEIFKVALIRRRQNDD